MVVVFKIRRIGTEEFSTGSTTPRFVSEQKAKTWKRISDVKNHLNHFKNPIYWGAKNNPSYLASIEVIKYTTIGSVVTTEIVDV